MCSVLIIHYHFLSTALKKKKLPDIARIEIKTVNFKRFVLDFLFLLRFL